MYLAQLPTPPLHSVANLATLLFLTTYFFSKKRLATNIEKFLTTLATFYKTFPQIFPAEQRQGLFCIQLVLPDAQQGYDLWMCTQHYYPTSTNQYQTCIQKMYSKVKKKPAGILDRSFFLKPTHALILNLIFQTSPFNVIKGRSFFVPSWRWGAHMHTQ